jgi:two-component system, NtrC family, response regulator HydG
VFYYLTMLKGARVGSHFPLNTEGKTLLGRGLECQVVLTDPLCSRVHCEIEQSPDGWIVRDHISRNGTYVEGRKIDEAQLVAGSELRIGSSVFEFRESAELPSDFRQGDANRTQTIVIDRELGDDSSNVFVNTFGEAHQGPDLGLLFDLSVKLIGCGDPAEVVKTGLATLQERTGADVVGFLWVSDDGQLKPQLVIPEEEAEKIQLSDELTNRVSRLRNALWIDNHTVSAAGESIRYADAICVPLLHDARTLGAIHVYKERGRFNQGDFDVAIHLARILTLALVRAREFQALRVDHQRLIDKSAAFDELIGESRPMLELRSRIARVARATGSVLVRGESGSGKELVARAIHKASQRSDRPMLSVNCAAIPRELMESQLFGHKRGAFTGADRDHIGWFEQAHTGTLFLDEVGELTLDGQAKLLRILEGHPFLPVGGTKEVAVDVRVIAATNRDLAEFVREGRFREDLYYRLSVFELCLPPLRERSGDVELLLDFFVMHFRRQHGRPQLRLSPAARDRLLAYHWPGNIRQLRNVIDSAVVMAESEVIEPGDLGLRDPGTRAGEAAEFDTLRVDVWERRLIAKALEKTSGNIPEAARLLGMGRATLYRKLEERTP